MESLEPDRWLSTKGKQGSHPLQITSSFRLPLIDGHSEYIGMGPICTNNCGLGWRFLFSATKADNTQPSPSPSSSKGSKGIPVSEKGTTFSISFDPHLVAASGLQGLLIDITVQNLSKTGKIAFPITLLKLSGNVQLAKYSCDADFSGNAVVNIIVRLETPFSISCVTVAEPLRVAIPHINEPPPITMQNALSNSLERPKTPPIPSWVNEPPRDTMQNILNHSLEGYDFVDTKFCLFTRRIMATVDLPNSITHVVTDPKVIFANGSLLRGHSSHLDQLLNGEQGEIVTGREIASCMPQSYEYESDSDLEDEDEDAADADGKEPESDEREKVIDVQRKGRLREDDSAILIADVAFKTWKSLVFYYYTGQVHFRPLASASSKSKEPSTSRPTCSPKSMFRLAKKMQITELQTLALDAIKRNLSAHNIVDEFFSQFTALYPEIRAVEVEVLMKVLNPEVFKDILEKMKPAFFTNPHYYDAVTAVLRSVTGNRSVLRSQIEDIGDQPPIDSPQEPMFDETKGTLERKEAEPCSLTPPLVSGESAGLD